MAQPFYPTEDELGFSLQSKSDALSIPHTLHSDSQQETLDRTLGCINTGVEIEAKGRGPTRRRIPVACQRCRRRKIRCSGDVGDGQGCSNCQSAGVTQCQFLRVNSSVMQTKVQASTASGWPYSSNDMASQRLTPYATSVASKIGGLPTFFPSHRVPSFTRAPDYEVAADAQNAYHRQAFGIDSALSYDDECSPPYIVQSSSAYMPPSSPQVFTADFSGMGWNPKDWGAVLQGGRTPAEPIFPDNDAENSLHNTAYTYVISGQGQQTNEAPSIAPIPGSMTSSVQGTERTLPNPAGRGSFSGNTNSSIIAADAISLSGLPSAHDYKAGSRWISKYEPRTPMTPVSNMPFNTATGDRAKLIPSSGQDMAFGLFPVASSSATSPLISSSGAFAGLEAAACATEVGDEFRGTADSRFRPFSRESRRMMSLSDYRPDTYGYSRPVYRNRPEAGDPSSESTLITGLPYTRPTHSVTLPQMDEKPALQAMAAHTSYTGLCSQ
ncbi:hypothetical protein BDV12DRAFT_185000 [Aspergillus spectabilis]